MVLTDASEGAGVLVLHHQPGHLAQGRHGAAGSIEAAMMPPMLMLLLASSYTRR
jgi:hypothetical protein